MATRVNLMDRDEKRRPDSFMEFFAEKLFL